MKERFTLNKETVRGIQIERLHERVRGLRERIVLKEEADMYLENALNEIVSLAESAILLEETTLDTSQKTKKDFEDAVFEKLGLPGVESLLIMATEKYASAIEGERRQPPAGELEAEHVPKVHPKFLLRQAIFNNVRPKLVEWLGFPATDRLLRTGVIDTWLQVLFFRNPLANVKDDFFIVKKKNIITFSIDDRGETRQSIALHREHLNIAGPHVSIAYMPPRCEQPFHAQKRIPEYNLLIQGKQELSWVDENGSTRTSSGKPGDIFHVPPLIVHTIHNETAGLGINLMVKPFFERRYLAAEYKSLSHVPVESPVVLTGTREHYEWESIILHNIKTVEGFHYELEVIDLLPGKELSLGPVRGGIPYEQEVVMSFAQDSLEAQRSGMESVVEINMGDVLYASAERYHLRNLSEAPSVLVRMRVLNSNLSSKEGNAEYV